MQLFTRVRRRIALTEHGAEYAGRIRHHLDQIEKDTFGLVSRTGMGRSIHIAVVPTLATTWLIPRLPDFQRAHPDITVSLSVRTLPFQFRTSPSTARCITAMACGRAQGALLFPERELVPVCAPELAARITGRGAEALAGLTHLHLSSRPDAWRQWYAANQYLYGPQAAGGPRYDGVHDGDGGVGLMPRFLLAQPALDQGRWPCPIAIADRQPGLLLRLSAAQRALGKRSSCSRPGSGRGRANA